METPSILPPTWQVPHVFRERLGAKVGRQRAMAADGHLLLVLHAPPKPDENRRTGRFFWLKPDGEWRSTEHGAGLGSLQSHVGEYAERIHQLDQLVDTADSPDDYFRALEQLAPLQRAARNMHDVLKEARKARTEVRELIDIRDESYVVERSAARSPTTPDTHFNVRELLGLSRALWRSPRRLSENRDRSEKVGKRGKTCVSSRRIAGYLTRSYATFGPLLPLSQ